MIVAGIFVPLTRFSCTVGKNLSRFSIQGATVGYAAVFSSVCFSAWLSFSALATNSTPSTRAADDLMVAKVP